MAPTRKSKTGSAPKRLFRCTGFGDCNMVFTRSEHLARHTRKHTGEKPFQCIVPGCQRMFSRFDNMMQHTQTHRPDEKHAGSHPPPPTVNNSNHHSSSSNGSNKRKLSIETSPSFEPHASHGGLLSPISLGPTDEWDETGATVVSTSDCGSVGDAATTPSPAPRQAPPLSVAALCNPPKETIHLTLDEFEALEGFARFGETPLFYESLRDLACIVEIDRTCRPLGPSRLT